MVDVAQAPALEREEDLRAQAYYDSEDAFNFYKEIWGGENIHVGVYEAEPAAEVETIKAASHRSLEKLFEKRPPAKGATIMDMGSAYGGCARYAAKTFGVKVSCVDLSAKENAVNAETNAAAGFSEEQIWIRGERSFTETGEPAESMDLVVSEDSFLHAGQYRGAAIREAARVLRPGGYLVFTDIMQSDNCDLSQMAPVYKRIGLDDMGSPSTYKRWAEEAGLVFEEFEDLTDMLPRHYGTVRKVLLAMHSDSKFVGKVSDEYVTNMSNGLQSWVDQAGNKNLAWGYMVFKKP